MSSATKVGGDRYYSLTHAPDPITDLAHAYPTDTMGLPASSRSKGHRDTGCEHLLQAKLARLRTVATRPTAHIIALQTAQNLVNPISQLLLVSKFGIAAFGVYLAAQALAVALERLVSFGVADFAVREIINNKERRNLVVQALLLFRVACFFVTTLIIFFVLEYFAQDQQYVLYFWLFWIIQFSIMTNKIIDALARALGQMRVLRALSAFRFVVDVVALVAVLAFDAGYVAFLSIRVVGFSLLFLGEMVHYRAYWRGLWSARRDIYATWRGSFLLSAYYGFSNTLRELTSQWLLVTYSLLVSSELFGLVGLAWRFQTLLSMSVNKVTNVVTLPRLIHGLQQPPARFFAVYRRLRLMHWAFGGASGLLLGGVLLATERWVLAADERFGLLFVASIVAYVGLSAIMVVPVKLIAAAGRVKERIPAQMAVALLTYAVLAVGVLVTPFYAFNLARTLALVSNYGALLPVVRRIEADIRRRGETTAAG